MDKIRSVAVFSLLFGLAVFGGSAFGGSALGNDEGNAAEEQKDATLPTVILRQSSNRARIYPFQPFDLAAEILVKDAVGNRLGVDPFVRVARFQPVRATVLSIPWGMDQRLPKGLRPLQAWEPWLETIPQSQYGFSINEVGVRVMQLPPTAAPDVPFDSGAFGFQNELLLFSPRPEKTEKTDAKGKTHTYWKYVISRRFVAESPGRFELTPLRIQGIFLTDGPANEPVLQGVRETGKPLTIEVLEVPRANRPPNDLGLSGVFTWNVALDKREATVGEPLTLTLTFSGVGSVSHAKAPDLSTIPAVAERFKTYPASEEYSDEHCRYVYMIRPKKGGTAGFPSLEFSYFNVESEQYVSLKSPPIPLNVEDTDRPDDDATPDRLQPSEKNDNGLPTTKKIRGGIYGNITEISGPWNHRVEGTRFFRFFVVLGILFVCSAVVVPFWCRNVSSTEKNRRRLALQRAKNEWDLAKELFARNETREGSKTLYNIFVRFVSEIQGVPFGQLPPGEPERFLLDAIGSPKKKAEIQAFFETINSFRFGVKNPDSEHDSRKRIQLVEQGTRFFETLSESVATKAANGKERTTSKKTTDKEATPLGENDAEPPTRPVSWERFALWMIASALVIFWFFPGPQQTASPEQRDRFEAAIHSFELAESKENSDSHSNSDSSTTDSQEAGLRQNSRRDYRRIAAMYQGLIDAGIESGPLFYNQGNAWIRAGEPEQAIVSYRRAGRYFPADPRLVANIKTVAKSPDPRDSGTLARTLFYPCGVLSYQGIMRLATGCVLLAFAVGLFALQFPGKKIAIFATILFFCSVYTISLSAFAWNRVERTEYGVVVSERTIPRTGNSQQYEPVGEEPLERRSEFTVRDSRGDWILVESTSGAIGWIPKADAIIY